MNENNIEKEVQARVDFKMNEFFIGLENTCKNVYASMFNPAVPMSRLAEMDKYHKFSSKVLDRFKKEWRMGLPRDDMYIDKAKQERDKAIEDIMTTFHSIFGIAGDSNQRKVFLNRVVSVIERLLEI